VRRASRAQHRFRHRLQHGVTGRQFADTACELSFADHSDLQAKAAQQATDAKLQILRLALQQFASDQQRPDFLGRGRLAVPRPESPHAQQLDAPRQDRGADVGERFLEGALSKAGLLSAKR